MVRLGECAVLLERQQLDSTVSIVKLGIQRALKYCILRVNWIDGVLAGSCGVAMGAEVTKISWVVIF